MKHPRSLAAISFLALLLASCGGGSGVNPALKSAAPMSAAARSKMAAAAGYASLYSFKGTPDGASPYSGLVAFNGALYGTTLNGSSNYCSQSCGGNECYLGCGTIFSVTTSGSENVVYNFKGNFSSAQDGSWPFPGMISLKGSLYGTTAGAGALGHGTVFTLDTTGKERVVYSFQGGSDGESPEAGLITYKTKLYGATLYGGGNGCGGAGCGVLYTLTTAGKESVLYAFQGGSDGERLFSGPVFINGKLYGATLFGGGTGCGGNGCGAIYEVQLDGKERVLYRFTGTTDGAFPNGLTAVNGVLYGTTEGGGNRNSGTFFSVTTSGTLATLYNFQDIPDGNLPGATLLYEGGKLYGTTVGGGTAGIGTVFSITKTGAEKVLYSFQGGTDGSDPQGPVYLYKHSLYGTTTTGGGTGCTGTGCGTIFKLKP